MKIVEFLRSRVGNAIGKSMRNSKNASSPKGKKLSEEESDDGGLTATEKSVARFVRERNEENFERAVSDFVFEVMAMNRRAYFPVNAAQLAASLGQEGAPMGTGIVRGAGGSPFLVFLTSQQMSTGTFDASVEMVASEIFVNVLPENGLAGIAVNPWNDGGVLIPKTALFAAVSKIGKMFDSD